jgi:hypothetical protein
MVTTRRAKDMMIAKVVEKRPTSTQSEDEDGSGEEGDSIRRSEDSPPATRKGMKGAPPPDSVSESKRHMMRGIYTQETRLASWWK